MTTKLPKENLVTFLQSSLIRSFGNSTPMRHLIRHWGSFEILLPSQIELRLTAAFLMKLLSIQGRGDTRPPAVSLLLPHNSEVALSIQKFLVESVST